jgi:hypothetical protein
VPVLMRGQRLREARALLRRRLHVRHARLAGRQQEIPVPSHLAAGVPNLNFLFADDPLGVERA